MLRRRWSGPEVAAGARLADIRCSAASFANPAGSLLARRAAVAAVRTPFAIRLATIIEAVTATIM